MAKYVYMVLFLAAFAALANAGQSAKAADLETQSRVIAKTRDYANAYINRLPDFVCTQTIVHASAGKKGDHWRKKDTVTAQLVFTGGKEKRTLQSINGKTRVNARLPRASGELTTEGEFGILLANILGADSAADLAWEGFANWKGAEVAVIKFSVDREHSTLKLSRSYLASAIVPYYGEVYADPQSGAVLHITKEISDIPPELETEKSLTIIDYHKVSIAGVDYFLPSQAAAEMTVRSGKLRNEMTFDSYRKFEASSTITFQP